MIGRPPVRPGPRPGCLVVEELPTLLWVDLTVSIREADLPERLNQAFHVEKYNFGTSMDAAIHRVRPSVVLFDFDYPNRDGLKLMQSTKRDYPSIPVLMFSVQHSEALAVWAFRAGVWDYLIRPISLRELDRCVSGLKDIFAMRRPQSEGRRSIMRASPIPEQNRLTQKGASMLALVPAIEYVEREFREKITSNQAAKICGMTPFQFSRAFKEQYGLTFQDYLLRYRIREACKYLRNPDAAVTDVAYLVGFNDPSYFARIFKRYINVTPSQFAEANAETMDPNKLLATLEAL